MGVVLRLDFWWFRFTVSTTQNHTAVLNLASLPIFLTILPVNAPLALLAFKDWLLKMKLTQYDREEGMASFLGKYNDPSRRSPRARAREGWSRLVQQCTIPVSGIFWRPQEGVRRL